MPRTRSCQTIPTPRTSRIRKTQPCKLLWALVASQTVLMGSAAPVMAQAGPNVNEIAKLLASDGAESDNFGFSVAVNGDTAVVGTPGDDGNDADFGSVYIFVRNAAGEWIQQAKLIASDGSFNSEFGSTVAIGGDTLVVGGSGGSVLPLSGSAYVFVRDDNGLWTQQTKLLTSDGFLGDGFGVPVTVSSDGNTAVVGAGGAISPPVTSGSAYVFTRDSGGVWTQQAKLLPSDGSVGDRFGGSVTINGDTIVVGSSFNDGNGTGSGSAYIFIRDTAGVWTQQSKLLASDGAAGDHFGRSVTINGDTVVVGSPSDDDNGTDSGSAYVFVRDATDEWTQQTKLLAFEEAAGDCFGWSVVINSNTAVVGTLFDSNVSDTGSAYSFARDAKGIWAQTAKLVASDGIAGDYFAGRSVAMSADTAVVGAKFDDDNGINSGSAYVFDLNFNPPGAFSLQTPEDGTPALVTPTLAWSMSTGLALTYTVRISTDINFTPIVLEQSGLTQTSFDVPEGVLEHNAVYFWGVAANDSAGDTISTPASFSFTTAPLGDFNGDGVVDGADLAALLTSWGPCSVDPAPCPADISGTGDGVVNGADLATLLANWGVLP